MGLKSGPRSVCTLGLLTVSACSHNWLKLKAPTVPLFLFVSSYMPVRVAVASSSHSWEQSVHSWEDEDADDLDGWGGECSDDDVVEEPTTPGGELVSYMFGLLMAGTLNAQQFCIAMHYANLAGCTGPCRTGPCRRCHGACGPTFFVGHQTQTQTHTNTHTHKQTF